MRCNRFVVEAIEPRRLLSGASISGVSFDDLNGDGVRQAASESQLPGWGCFLDANNNGVFDAGQDVRTYADANGHYQFTGLAAGTYHISQMTPAGWQRTVPLKPRSYTVTLAANGSASGLNFGSVRVTAGAALDANGTLVVTGSSAADTIHVETDIFYPSDPAVDYVTVTLNGAMQAFVPANVQQVYVNALGGNDQVSILEASNVSLVSATVLGGDGNDVLDLNAQADITSAGFVLMGGSGDDTISGRCESLNSDVTIDGGDGADQLGGAASSLMISGDAGNDSIGTDDFGSTMYATLVGGAGDDSFSFSSDTGGAMLRGGAGVDSVTFDGSNGDTRISLDDQPDGLFDSGWADIGSDVENVDVFAGNNVTLTGDAANNRLVVDIEANSDVINGGGGNDTLVGGAEQGTMHGGDGNDLLLPLGETSVYGDAGNDTIAPSIDSGLISGGPGTDIVDYHNRIDDMVIWLDGSHPSGSTNPLNRQAARFDGTVEIVYGGSGNDYIVGTKGNNALFGNGGNDTIFGGGGVDAFFGGSGNDQIHAKDGNKDFIDGGAGNDSAVADLIDTVVNVETVSH